MIKKINVNELRELINTSEKYGHVIEITEIETKYPLHKEKIGLGHQLNIFFEVSDETEEKTGQKNKKMGKGMKPCRVI